MKILMYGKYKPYRSNGVYTAIEHLIRVMVRGGHDVKMLTPTSKYNKINDDFALSNGFKLESCRGAFGMWSIYKCLKVLICDRPDVVHFQYVRYPSQLIVSLLCVLLQIRQVISVHDGYSKGYFSKRKFKKYLYFFVVDYWLLQLVNHVHCVSEREKSELIKWLLNKKKLSVAPNVYIQKSNRGLDSNKRNIQFGYLGRIDFDHKNIEYQSTIINYLYNEGNHGRFHLCGPLRERDAKKLNHLRTKVGIELICHEPKFGNDKDAFLRDTRIFMHASKWELFGYSILEAIDAGCHVVISNKCDIASTVQNLSFISILSGEEKLDVEVLKSCMSIERDKHAEELERCSFLDSLSNTDIISKYVEFYSGVNR